MPKHGQWYHDRQGFITQGSWGWNDHRLWKKIDTEPDLNGCLNYNGAQSPTGALMGAYRDGKIQMTQARRLVWMSKNKEDVTPYQIKLKCGNQRCCNHEHFVVEKNNRTDSL